MTSESAKRKAEQALAEYLATLFRKMAAQKRREAEFLLRMAEKWDRRR